MQNPTGRERRAYAHCVAAILLDGRQFFPGVRRAKLPCSARDVTDDPEVVCVGERTVEQRNKEGFANAIVLDEDELLTVRVLPPKGM